MNSDSDSNKMKDRDKLFSFLAEEPWIEFLYKFSPVEPYQVRFLF